MTNHELHQLRVLAKTMDARVEAANADLTRYETADISHTFRAQLMADCVRKREQYNEIGRRLFECVELASGLVD